MRFARLLPLLLLALLPAGLSAQSASDIMADFRAHYEDMMAGIDDYTVVQDVMGTRTTIYYERDVVDGITIFRPRMDIAGVNMPEDRGRAPQETFFLRPDVAERMTYEGTDEVDGEACEVVRLDDFSGLEDVEDMAAEGMEMKSMSFCLDTDDHLARRMEMKGTMTMEGESREMTTVAHFSDYREVGGMMHPWRIEMTMEGMGMDPEQRAQMEQAMAEMEKQLEQLPESQRERMREMMKSRMPDMEGMMGVMSGEPMVIETVDVKVNAGPPEGGDR